MNLTYYGLRIVLLSFLTVQSILCCDVTECHDDRLDVINAISHGGGRYVCRELQEYMACLKDNLGECPGLYHSSIMNLQNAWNQYISSCSLMLPAGISPAQRMIMPVVGADDSNENDIREAVQDVAEDVTETVAEAVNDAMEVDDSSSGDDVDIVNDFTENVADAIENVKEFVEDNVGELTDDGFDDQNDDIGIETEAASPEVDDFDINDHIKGSLRKMSSNESDKDLYDMDDSLTESLDSDEADVSNDIDDVMEDIVEESVDESNENKDILDSIKDRIVDNLENVRTYSDSSEEEDVLFNDSNENDNSLFSSTESSSKENRDESAENDSGENISHEEGSQEDYNDIFDEVNSSEEHSHEYHSDESNESSNDNPVVDIVKNIQEIVDPLSSNSKNGNNGRVQAGTGLTIGQLQSAYNGHNAGSSFSHQPLSIILLMLFLAVL